MIDPVRFLSNLSTGEMGYAIARLALRKKHDVTLISGPTDLEPPARAKFIPIMSALDLRKACIREFSRHDVLIMVAAVSDFTAENPRKKKIQRARTRMLKLRRTPDILAGLGKRKGRRVVIGFCLETEDWLNKAKLKLKKKSLSGIVANHLGARHNPFGPRKVTTAFLDNKGNCRVLRKRSKDRIAGALLSWAETL